MAAAAAWCQCRCTAPACAIPTASSHGAYLETPDFSFVERHRRFDERPKGSVNSARRLGLLQTLRHGCYKNSKGHGLLSRAVGSTGS